MDNLGTSFGSKTFFPGRDERGVGDDFTSGIDRADIFEDIIGDLIFGNVGHRSINALNAVIGKGFDPALHKNNRE